MTKDVEAKIDDGVSETSDIDAGVEKKSNQSSKEEEKKASRSESRKRGDSNTRAGAKNSAKPVKLHKGELLTRTEMVLQRKYLNINRWNCVSRP